MPDAHAMEELARLVDIMARLRGPDGCPWDRQQTPASLRPYVLEEACEVLDAIEGGIAASVCEELGDLLLQVVFQAQIAAESGEFTIADVARAIADKLVRRHPHVFADVRVRDADEVMRNWRTLKAAERGNTGDTGVLDRVPSGLPALARAQDVGERLAQVGFDWPDVLGVLAKLREEQRELEAAVAAGDPARASAELGDLLLTATSVARHLRTPAEMALRDATTRLIVRVHHVEAAARSDGQSLSDLGPDQRDRLWVAAKRADAR